MRITRNQQQFSKKWSSMHSSYPGLSQVANVTKVLDCRDIMLTYNLTDRTNTRIIPNSSTRIDNIFTNMNSDFSLTSVVSSLVNRPMTENNKQSFIFSMFYFNYEEFYNITCPNQKTKYWTVFLSHRLEKIQKSAKKRSLNSMKNWSNWKIPLRCFKLQQIIRKVTIISKYIKIWKLITEKKSANQNWMVIVNTSNSPLTSKKQHGIL